VAKSIKFYIIILQHRMAKARKLYSDKEDPYFNRETAWTLARSAIDDIPDNIIYEVLNIYLDWEGEITQQPIPIWLTKASREKYA
jgi:hypothetical protein